MSIKQTIIQTLLLLTIAAVLLLMVAKIAWGGVTETKHNLSTAGPASNTFKLTSGTDQVCVFCHTPHFSGATSAPLWNKTTAATGYTMYASPTINMTIAGQPQGVSAACLSCHDGTIAFDTFLNAPGSGLALQDSWTWNGGKSNMTTSAAAYLSKDLSNDHPVSVTYDASQDPAFVVPAGGAVGGLPLYGSAQDQVECASCHNVHDNTNAPFLRVANGGSALCLKCHIK